MRGRRILAKWANMSGKLANSLNTLTRLLRRRRRKLMRQSNKLQNSMITKFHKDQHTSHLADNTWTSWKHVSYPHFPALRERHHQRFNEWEERGSLNKNKIKRSRKSLEYRNRAPARKEQSDRKKSVKPYQRSTINRKKYLLILKISL